YICIDIAYHYSKWCQKFNYWSSRGIPGPKPIPYFGNTLSPFLKPRPFVEMEWYNTYGRLYGKYNCGQPVPMVADPALVRQILVKDFNKFRNRDFKKVSQIMSSNLFSTRDGHWKRIRAIASPTFTSAKLKHMYPLINSCCGDFLAALERDVSAGKSAVELKRLMCAYTMDVIASCAFSIKTNSYSDPNNPFTTKANRILNMFGSSAANLLNTLLPAFLFNNRLTKCLVTIGLTNIVFFIGLSQRLISERKKSGKKHNDILQYFMDVKREDSIPSTTTGADSDQLMAEKQALSGVVERRLTDDEVVAQSVMFFLAGVEGTAITLSYLVYELALNPDIQDLLVAETAPAFNDSTGDIDYESLLRLPLVDAVVSETLRKYTPALSLVREAMEDVVLTNDTDGSKFKIEKGMNVEIPVYAIHHDPDNYPDPECFKPERFLPENRHNLKPYTYLPFGVGPRNCIGMRFALLEIKLAMVKLVRQFRFYRLPNTDVPAVFTRGRIYLLCHMEIAFLQIQ
ncbi:unnamed protein product, partial [Medioppia subpectinata]